MFSIRIGSQIPFRKQIKRIEVSGVMFYRDTRIEGVATRQKMTEKKVRTWVPTFVAKRFPSFVSK